MVRAVGLEPTLLAERDFSLRPVILAMRRIARALGGSSRVRSRVRYRMTGIASLVSVVNTSSPSAPSGSTAPVKGSMISG